jgi:hypothetical protein
VDPFGTGRSLTEHGIRSMTSHSTAFFSSHVVARRTASENLTRSVGIPRLEATREGVARTLHMSWTRALLTRISRRIGRPACEPPAWTLRKFG